MFASRVLLIERNYRDDKILACRGRCTGYTQSKDPMSPYPVFCIRALLTMLVYPSPFPRSSASHSQDAAEVISRTDPSDKREMTSYEWTKECTSDEESFDSFESKIHLRSGCSVKVTGFVKNPYGGANA